MSDSQPTLFSRRTGPMVHILARNWWLVLLRGIAAILFGVLALSWPSATLLTLVILYGAYALADGVLSLIAAASHRGALVPRWWLIVAGLLGIAAGLFTLLWPGVTALILITFIGIWALVRGISEIIEAIRLRKQIENEWFLILAGLLSAVFGLAVLVAPGAGALALIWVIGIYAIAFGILLVAFSLRLRKLAS